jgi:hypothetical protein
MVSRTGLYEAGCIAVATKKPPMSSTGAALAAATAHQGIAFTVGSYVPDCLADRAPKIESRPSTTLGNGSVAVWGGRSVQRIIRPAPPPVDPAAVGKGVPYSAGD